MSPSHPTLSILAAAALLASGCGAWARAPWLLNAQQPSFATRPEYIRDHFHHIDTLPFDGMVIGSETASAIMDGTARSEDRMTLDFAPLNGLAFQRMTGLQDAFSQVAWRHRSRRFLPRWNRAQCRPALAAELVAGGILRATGIAARGEPRPALAAELRAGRIPVTALRAVQAAPLPATLLRRHA